MKLGWLACSPLIGNDITPPSGWRARQARSANPNVHLPTRHKEGDVWFGADPAVEARSQTKALTCDDPWRLIAVWFQDVAVRGAARSNPEGPRTGDGRCRRRGGPTGAIRHRWMVHDPRSPCEGSWRAVHLVVLVEKLQETLVDGVQVTTRKSFTAPSNPILPDEKPPEQIDSVSRLSLRRWGSHLSAVSRHRSGPYLLPRRRWPVPLGRPRSTCQCQVRPRQSSLGPSSR